LITLVLGGARSGKSRFAERLIAATPPPWLYIATAEALDTEMASRIATHQARRSADWVTREAPHDLTAALTSAADRPVLIDCLTLWLSNRMLAEADVETEVVALLQALAQHKNTVVAVANEVGLGIVPDNALARRFRDLQGVLNQRIAAVADRVILMVAGLPVVAKGSL
jgi:adenosylcobinamide kinase / adenosylcobinamide-phosphate guanylyltransferase